MGAPPLQQYPQRQERVTDFFFKSEIECEIKILFLLSLRMYLFGFPYTPVLFSLFFENFIRYSEISELTMNASSCLGRSFVRPLPVEDEIMDLDSWSGIVAMTATLIAGNFHAEKYNA